MSARYPVIVIGGGVSGLACAHALQSSGVDVRLFEARTRPGGVIRSERRDGYLVEFGPQSFSATRPLARLIDSLGIGGKLVEAPRLAPRFVMAGGSLAKVPLHPAAFFTSGLLGVGSKASVLRDLLGRSQPPGEDESVGDFVRRKFSRELLDKLVGPMVSGIYAGDPERLSLRSAFPQVHAAEERSGSVLRGMLFEKPAEGPRQRPALVSFAEGNETLIEALAGRLGAALQCRTRVTGLRASGPRTFAIDLEADGARETVETGLVVFATPAAAAAELAGTLDPELGGALREIECAPVAVVSTGYRRRAVGHGLEGFGFLVPRSAGLRTLGTVWNSSLFPGRSPAGHVLFSSFVGGATDPGAAAVPPEDLVRLVHREISPLVGITEPPVFQNVQIYPSGIPQYNLGHAERLGRIEAARIRFPGLYFAGSYFSGPSIGSCLDQALAVAEQLRIGYKS